MKALPRKLGTPRIKKREGGYSSPPLVFMITPFGCQISGYYPKGGTYYAQEMVASPQSPPAKKLFQARRILSRAVVNDVGIKM